MYKINNVKIDKWNYDLKWNGMIFVFFEEILLECLKIVWFEEFVYWVWGEFGLINCFYYCGIEYFVCIGKL